jgi:hypothetical protein
MNDLAFQSVRSNIIDILNIDQVSLGVVQVLNEGAVASRPEMKQAVLVAKGLIIQIDSNRVRRRLLKGKTKVEASLAVFLIMVFHSRAKIMKIFLMLWGHSEVDSTPAIGIPEVPGGIDEVFFQWSSAFRSVSMKLYESLWEGAIIQTLWGQQVVQELPVLRMLHQFPNGMSILRQNLFKILHERKFGELFKESNEITCNSNTLFNLQAQFVRIQKMRHVVNLEQGLEHAGCRPRCRDKFLKAALLGRLRMQM